MNILLSLDKNNQNGPSTDSVKKEVLNRIKPPFKYTIFIDTIRTKSGDNCPFCCDIRCSIIEIAVAPEVYFVLNKRGVASAYSRKYHTFLCYLNSTPGESIISINFNPEEFSILITNGMMETKSINLLHIMKNKTLEYKLIFKGDGLMDYSTSDNYVMLKNNKKRKYDFYNLKRYERIYTYPSAGIFDIKLEDHKNVIIIYEGEGTYVDYGIFNIVTKKTIKKERIELPDNCKLEILELVNDTVIYSIERNNIILYNFINNSILELDGTNFANRFIILNKCYNCFILLLFNDNNKMLCWKVNGVKIAEVQVDYKITFSLIKLYDDMLFIYNKDTPSIMIYNNMTLELIQTVEPHSDKERLAMSNVESMNYDVRNSCIILGDSNGYIHILEI